MQLRKYRLKLGITQQELADKASVSKTHISDLENSRRIPSVRLLFHLSAILKTKPCELMEYSCDLYCNEVVNLEYDI